MPTRAALIGPIVEPQGRSLRLTKCCGSTPLSRHSDVNSPAVRPRFDSHNAIDETEPHANIVKKQWDLIRHIHVNELDGSYPRPGGGYDFKPVLQVAKDRAFGGWVSMEVFDFTPGSEKIVTEAYAYLRDQIGQLN